MLLLDLSMMNQLPSELKDEMQEHLRLKFNHQEASDDQVGALTWQGTAPAFSTYRPCQAN